MRIHKKGEEDRNRLEVELQELENRKEEQKKNLEKQIEDEKKRADARVSERLAKEKEVPKKVAIQPTGGCEQYRGLVSQYSWDIDTALFVMKKESECNPNAVSRTNDHGLFQIHGERIYDPAQNIARAYQKYVGGRVGKNNFSAWYAVCTPSAQPKYAGIKCNG